jgi:hypothetical protein
MSSEVGLGLDVAYLVFVWFTVTVKQCLAYDLTLFLANDFTAIIAELVSQVDVLLL